jgi:hypothetical protein
LIFLGWLNEQSNKWKDYKIQGWWLEMT